MISKNLYILLQRLTSNFHIIIILLFLNIFPLNSVAQMSISPNSLMHYSNCISEAKDRNRIFFLDRGTMFRCRDDIAASYFNYLGRMRVQERRVRLNEGVFIYRDISGVGKCWNQIEDPSMSPVSLYGCDIYVQM